MHGTFMHLLEPHHIYLAVVIYLSPQKPGISQHEPHLVMIFSLCCIFNLPVIFTPVLFTDGHRHYLEPQYLALLHTWHEIQFCCYIVLRTIKMSLVFNRHKIRTKYSSRENVFCVSLCYSPRQISCMIISLLDTMLPEKLS